MKEIVEFELNSLEESASNNYKAICRFGNMEDKMADLSLELKKQILNSIKPIAKYERLRANIYDGSLVIGEFKFGSPVFSKVFSKNDMRQVDVFVYAITIGEYEQSIKSDSVIDTLLLDCWATAYIDAAREQLTNKLCGENGDKKAFSIAPGIFEMPMQCMGDLFSLIEPDIIGIKLNSSFVMSPQKSCAGFLLIGEHGLFADSCGECKANTTSCNYCRLNDKQLV